MKKLKAKFLIWFRKRYEARVSLPFGISQFIANVAFIQLSKEEYIDLNPCSSAIGTIRVTTTDMRPMLTYKYWREGMEWTESLPMIQVIVEQRGFQLRELGAKTASEWELVTIEDARVAVLKDLFLAWAFYAGLRPDWKHKLPEVVVEPR